MQKSQSRPIDRTALRNAMLAKHFFQTGYLRVAENILADRALLQLRRTVIKLIVLALSLVLACNGIASADTPGKDRLTPEQVTEKLMSQGFSRVIKLEADDGHWEGDAVKGGKTFEIHVDPHSGALTKSELKD